MSPTMHMTAPPAHYQPTSDMMDRHEYGVLKNRKTASTGGGRAWSEDEVCLFGFLGFVSFQSSPRCEGLSGNKEVVARKCGTNSFDQVAYRLEQGQFQGWDEG